MKKTFILLCMLMSLWHITKAQDGQFIPGGFAFGDSLRTYVVYVPPGYDGSTAWPLVINMHGLTANMQQQVFSSNMEPVADTGQFLIVYPQALWGPIGPSWNDILAPNLPDDIGFLDQLIDRIALSYHIDPAKIYATGLSQGGAMSHLLACQLPNRVAAVASVAGPVLDPVFNLACNLDRPIPILQMHGTADPIAPFDGGFEPFPGFSTPPLDDYVQFWIEQNNCTGDPTIVNVADTNTADSSTVEIRKYENCDSESEVYYYIIENGSHVWPGGPPVPPGFEFLGTNVNRDIHASVEIWNFFKRHTNPNPTPLPRLVEETVMMDTLERKYLLYIPAAYNGSEEWPLVFNLHGSTSNPQEQMVISNMNAVADTGHFLVVYPEGILNLGGNTGWNEPQSPTLQNDVLFINTLIDSISSKYLVNQHKIYSCGLSNGGGMSFTLASTLSDRLAAVASVAAPGTLTPTPNRPIPILYMHGTADRIVPFNGGASDFVPIVFPAAWDRVQFWKDNNGCLDSTQTMLPDILMTDSSMVELTKYQACTSYPDIDSLERPAEFWFYKILNGGHTWAGGPPVPPGLEPIFGHVNRDIHASSEIWNFFKQHTLPANITNRTEHLQSKDISLNVFPNPATSRLTFEFELSKSAEVQLSLYNTLGQQVAQIIDSQTITGFQHIEWQTRSLPSGLYYFHLTIGKQVISKPIVLKK